MLEAARAGQGSLSFGVLACAELGLLRAPRWLLVAALAWRLHGAAAADDAQPCCSFLTLVARFLARFSSPPAARRMLPRTLTFFTCGR